MRETEAKKIANEQAWNASSIHASSGAHINLKVAIL